MLDLLPRPGRALVREMERVVIMEGNEQVRIGGKAEERQVLEAVPVRRTDHDDAGRVRLADDAENLREQLIPWFAIELVVRLVEQLERDVARRLGEAGCDLLPKCRKLRPADVEILRAGVEVVLVDDHAKARLLRLADHV